MCSAFIARLLAGSVEWDEREKRKNEKGTKEILIDGETGKFMNLFVDWLFGFRGTRQKVFAGNQTTISKTLSTASRQTLRSTKLFLLLFCRCHWQSFSSFSLLFVQLGEKVLIPIISPLNERLKQRGDNRGARELILCNATIHVVCHINLPSQNNSSSTLARNRRPPKKRKLISPRRGNDVFFPRQKHSTVQLIMQFPFLSSSFIIAALPLPSPADAPLLRSPIVLTRNI